MRIASLLALASLIAPLLAHAGVFSVSPIRVDLSPTAKAGSVTVSNEGSALTLKTSLMRWTQDDNGVDHYEPSTDLVYFPRDTVVPTQGSRVVRAALNTQPGEVEQAYRLYIEEVQAQGSEDAKASRIAVLVRFGVPIYIAPSAAKSGVSLEALPGDNNVRQVRIRNSGTTHLYVKAVSAPGVAFASFKSRYLLAGAAFQLGVTEAACKEGSTSVTVEAEEGNFTATLPAEVCAR